MPLNAASGQQTPRTSLLAALLVLPLILSIAAVWIFDHSNAHASLFDLTNLVGPTTESLLHNKGLTVCTETMGTPGNPICFRSGRMPLPTAVVSMGIELLGNRYLPVAFFKALLLLLPLEFAIYLVWRRMPPSPGRTLAISALLLAPFTMTMLLANVVNLQVEEGYSWSFLALAVAILFFAKRPASAETSAQTSNESLLTAILFSLAVDGIYLAKSSMIAVVAVLLLSFLWLERRASHRLLVLALIAAAPIGWALYQHHASGRYTLGTSIDGINLHKSNNPDFLKHYPPPPGDSLDEHDADLNRNLHFPNEWSYNDYHRNAAIAWLETHPRETLQGDLRKLDVFFISVRKYGSSESHGAMLLAETAGLLLFRLILWAAIFGAIYVLYTGKSPPLRAAGAIFLALVAACALPYIAGFAYTRHVSVLVYPAVLMCCRILAEHTRYQKNQTTDSLFSGKHLE